MYHIKKKRLISTFGEKGWYPKSKSEFLRLVNTHFDNHKLEPKMIDALVLPHAGYLFSAKTAIETLKTIRPENYDQVVIIGPSHYFQLHNKAYLTNYDSIQTEFSAIDLQKEYHPQLISSGLFEINDEIFQPEHSIQVLVPLIQYFFQKPRYYQL